MKTVLEILILLIWTLPLQSRGEIYLQGPTASPSQFQEWVVRQQGESFSDFTLRRLSSPESTDELLSLGEKFLGNKISEEIFFQRLQEIRRKSILKEKDRLLIAEILLQKLRMASREEFNSEFLSMRSSLQNLEKSPLRLAFCYFYLLDGRIQETWPQHIGLCKRSQTSLEKFSSWRDSGFRISLDGVLISRDQEFVSVPEFFPWQIHFVSDSHQPLAWQGFFKDFSLQGNDQAFLVPGNCEKFEGRLAEFAQYQKENIKVFFEDNCVRDLNSHEVPRDSFRSKNSKSWMWLGAALILGVAAYSLRDKEISVSEFSWSF